MNADAPNPGKPLDPRLLLYLFIGFFMIPGLICGGCVAASAYIPRRFVQPAIERPQADSPAAEPSDAKKNAE